MSAAPNTPRPRDPTAAARARRYRKKLRERRTLDEMPSPASVQKLVDADLIPAVWTTRALLRVLANFINWQCSTPGMIAFLKHVRRDQEREQEIAEVFGNVQLGDEDAAGLSGGEIFDTESPAGAEFMRRLVR